MISRRHFKAHPLQIESLRYFKSFFFRICCSLTGSHRHAKCFKLLFCDMSGRSIGNHLSGKCFKISIDGYLMILIALGANLAHEGREPAETIKHAIRVLDRLFTLDKVSSLYVSPAWPDPAEPPFINAVVTSDKTLPPETRKSFWACAGKA